MTMPKNRSKSKKEIRRKMPGGKTVKLYKAKKKFSRHYSAVTHEPLRGVSSDPSLPKSRRVPTRIYAGHLGPLELRTVLKYANRVKFGMMKIDDVDIKYRKYVEAQIKE